jgi:hypothetical protein
MKAYNVIHATASLVGKNILMGGGELGRKFVVA